MNLLNSILAMKLIQILKNFLDTNAMWKQFFIKNKDKV